MEHNCPERNSLRENLHGRAGPFDPSFAGFKLLHATQVGWPLQALCFAQLSRRVARRPTGRSWFFRSHRILRPSAAQSHAAGTNPAHADAATEDTAQDINLAGAHVPAPHSEKTFDPVPDFRFPRPPVRPGALHGLPSP